MQSKRFIIAAALTLCAGFAAAGPAANSPEVKQLRGYVDGSEYQLANMPFTSTRTRAEVKAEARAVNRVPLYVDGSEYELAMTMFMSNKTREMVRNEAFAARHDRDNAEAFGGRN